MKSALKDWTGCITDCNKVLELSQKRRNGLPHAAPSKSRSKTASGDVFNDAVVYYTRAEAHYHSQKYYDCLSDCDSSLLLHPHFPEALCCRGAAHNALGNYTSALADLDIAIKTRPKYGVAKRHRGIAEYMRGEYASAVRDLKEEAAMNGGGGDGDRWLVKAEGALKKAEEEAERRAEELCREEVEDRDDKNGEVRNVR